MSGVFVCSSVLLVCVGRGRGGGGCERRGSMCSRAIYPDKISLVCFLVFLNLKEKTCCVFLCYKGVYFLLKGWGGGAAWVGMGEYVL